MLPLGIGGHGDHSMKLFGSHKCCCDNQWPLTGCYFKHCVTHFDSLGAEHIPKEITKSIVNKKIITNTYRIQAYDLTMCVYFWIGFIDFTLKGNSLLDYTNLFSPNDYEKVIK